ncbi:hypothetical protein AKJ09_00633 [Labilithrix luteola]|uniref:Uncharacterized protein n=1 Tax=Labilithrix luteola TaxID=1391654 RepID=A0A0K1PLH4_9BACT|nr:hypothetical protein [Labilithrix luteola]AKU93969.1 hypothetical protein AKJ09_00633 [Labilithrix luteola]
MATSEHEIRELVARHRINYRVTPEWGPDAHWHQQKIGFQIELYGVVADESTSADPPPLDTDVTNPAHDALDAVASFAFGNGNKDVMMTVDPYRAELVREPSLNAWGVELVGHVLHNGDVRRPADAAQARYVAEVKQRLSKIGVHER